MTSKRLDVRVLLTESNSDQTHDRLVAIGMERTIEASISRLLRLCVDANNDFTLTGISCQGDALSRSRSGEAHGL
jgi:hypothetical protein